MKYNFKIKNLDSSLKNKNFLINKKNIKNIKLL